MNENPPSAPYAGLMPSDPAHPYWNGEHPGHQAAVEEVRARFVEELGSEDVSTSARFRTTFGVAGTEAKLPVVPYELKRPGPAEAWPSDEMRDLSSTVSEMGLPESVAQQFVDAIAVGGLMPQLPVSHRVSAEQAEATLREQWGAEFDERLTLARQAAERAGPHVIQALSRAGWDNEPEVVAYFARLGARAAIKAILGDPGHSWHRADARGHGQAIAQMTRLHRLAVRG